MKKVSLLLILAFTAIAAFAQESGVSAEAGRKATFTRNGFCDNWFVGAGAGATMYFGPEDQHAGFFNRMTVNPELFVGKWFNPYLGVRGAAQGGRIHTFVGENAEKMYSQTLFNAHVDFMFNVTNYFLKYKEDRFYNFIPTVGAGYAHRFDDKFKYRGMNGITFNASLLNTFRITNRLDAFAEVGGMLIESRFDRGANGDSHWNGIMTGSVGLILNIGKNDFSEAYLMDQGLIDDLNDQINKLRQENAKLALRPESCPQCPETTTKTVEVIKTIGSNNMVIFRLGSANIDTNQEANIYATAKALQENPNAKVKVIGYADKKTGSASINERLSEKRAKNVANQLINKYNINSSRVTIEWKGDSTQPFSENSWNRVAIMIQE